MRRDGRSAPARSSGTCRAPGGTCRHGTMGACRARGSSARSGDRRLLLVAAARAPGRCAACPSPRFPRRLGIAVVVAIVVGAVVVASNCSPVRPPTSPAPRRRPRAVPAPTGFEAVVAEALPSVVQIRSERGLGSGRRLRRRRPRRHQRARRRGLAALPRDARRRLPARGDAAREVPRGRPRGRARSTARGRGPPSSPTRRACGSASTRSRSATRSVCARA